MRSRSSPSAYQCLFSLAVVATAVVCCYSRGLDDDAVSNDSSYDKANQHHHHHNEHHGQHHHDHHDHDHHRHHGHFHHHTHKDKDGNEVKCGSKSVRHLIRKHVDAHLRHKEASLKALPEEEQKQIAARRLQAAPTPWPIRIFPEYQISNLDAQQTALIKNLVNSAIKSLQKFLKVKQPVNGNLLVPRQCGSYWQNANKDCATIRPDFDNLQPSDTCGRAVLNPNHFASYKVCSQPFNCITKPGGNGEATDVYMYVTAGNDAGCDVEYLAYALPCWFDLSTQRPLLGTINICPSTITNKTSQFDRQVGIIAHEMLHALGFEESMYKTYVDPNGQMWGESNVVSQVQLQNGVLSRAIVTPTVVEEARKFFGCSTLKGAPIEDEGGEGVAESHWEWRVFQGDVMASVLPSDGSVPQITRMTLALMKDTGWYEPIWEAAGWVNWGRAQGCDFVELPCTDFMTKNPNQKFFCNTEPNEQNICTNNLLASGTCAPSNVSNKCSTYVAFSSIPNCVISSSLGVMTMPFWRYGFSSRCFTSQNPIKRVNGQTTSTWGIGSNSDGYCLPSRCEGNQLQVSLEGTWVNCPAGQSVQLADSVKDKGFIGGAFGPCPDNTFICSTLGCPNNCSGNGQCWNGTCYCNIAYYGKDCGDRADGLPPFPPAPPGEIAQPLDNRVPVVRAPSNFGQIGDNAISKAQGWVSKNRSLVIIIAASVGSFIVVLLLICCIRRCFCGPKLAGAQYMPNPYSAYNVPTDSHRTQQSSRQNYPPPHSGSGASRPQQQHSGNGYGHQGRPAGGQDSVGNPFYNYSGSIPGVPPGR